MVTFPPRRRSESTAISFSPPRPAWGWCPAATSFAAASIRALPGVFRETADGGQRTADALKHLRDDAITAFNEKYKLFIESDAQKTLAEINKLKVFLTTDLGAAIVETANKMLGFAGGADAIGEAVKAMIPIVVTGVSVFAGYAAVLGAVALDARLATVGLTPWAWPSTDCWSG